MGVRVGLVAREDLARATAATAAVLTLGLGLVREALVGWAALVVQVA
jgi:hypothetical protein